MNSLILGKSVIEPNFFDEDKIKEIQECFKMFDKDKDNYVKFNELKNILRALNHEISDDELLEVIKEIKDLRTNKLGDPVISYDQFEFILTTLLRDEDISQELYDAFMNFVSPGLDYIQVDKFSHFMKTLGDKLSDEEVDEMIKDLDPENTGNIYVDQFIRLMMTK